MAVFPGDDELKKDLKSAVQVYKAYLKNITLQRDTI